MEPAFAVLTGDEPDADLATLAAELGRLHFFKGEIDLAAERIDTAIEIAESLWLPDVLSNALNTQGLIAGSRGHFEQARALIVHALELALEHDLNGAALRAYNNLGDLLDRRDRYEEAIVLLQRGLELAHRAGDRRMEWLLLGELAWYLTRVGRWSEALELAAQVPQDSPSASPALPHSLVEIAAARGDHAEARRLLSSISDWRDSADVQARSSHAVLNAQVLRAEGRHAEALVACDEVLNGELLGEPDDLVTRNVLGEALQSALALGRLDTVGELLARIEAIPPGKRPPSLGAQAARFRALLAAARGERDGVEQGFKTAAAVFREYGLGFHLGLTQLEHGEWLTEEGRPEEAEPLLDEAREIFERLEATPWLDRAGVMAEVEVSA